MIKVGILGAENAPAGELLRVLLNHPEVELLNVVAPSLVGRAVSSFHRGLIGETTLRFTESVDLEKLDLVFITSPNFKVSEISPLPPELKVIFIQGRELKTAPVPFDTLIYVPGVSEVYRKPLVREAQAARILPSATSLALIALAPLAGNLLLNNSVKVNIQVPQNRVDAFNADSVKEELESLLGDIQLSLKGLGEVTVESSDTIRALSAEIDFDSDIDKQEIIKIYESVYDDHNFTFVVTSDPSPSEVAGTHKCLIYVTSPHEGKIRIKAVADSVLRGGAGDAIHAMNLLFGLFEKTGLSLPAGLAFNDELLSKL